jgi:hypothetical protein
MMKPILFEQLVPENREEFKSKAAEIAGKLDVNPDWLMLVFYIETAAVRYGVINHRIQNGIGATGLIQFMPATAKALGTSGDALKKMSNVRQLDYVYRYLLPYKGQMKSFTDVYFAVFFPAAIGKSDDWVLQTKGLSPEKIACANPLYDLDRDKKIRVSEVKQKILKFVPKGYKL